MVDAKTIRSLSMNETMQELPFFKTPSADLAILLFNNSCESSISVFIKGHFYHQTDDKECRINSLRV